MPGAAVPLPPAYLCEFVVPFGELSRRRPGRVPGLGELSLEFPSALLRLQPGVGGRLTRLMELGLETVGPVAVLRSFGG